MATTKQKIVIGKLLANPSESLYKVMRSAGYAHATAKAPTKNLLSQPGFQQLLEEFLPDTMLLKALHDDIKTKVGNRHRELDLALKVKGRLKSSDDPAPSSVYNTFIQQNNLNPNTPTAKQLVDASLDVLMAQTKRKVIDGN